MTRIAKLVHLPVPDQALDGDGLGVGLDQASSSFVHLPSSELSRSGLYQALQEPPSADSLPSQNIEMEQLQPHISDITENSTERRLGSHEGVNDDRTPVI